MIKSLKKYKLSFFLGKYLEVEWLGHIVGVCLTFQDAAKLPSKVMYERATCAPFSPLLAIISLFKV